MYKGAMYAIKKSGMTLSEWVTMCGKFFKDGAWFGSYGGKAWYDICEGWLMLNNATSISGNMGVMSMLQKGAKKPEMQIPMGVAIDYIYDLQHNTGSVLNKMKAYYEGGYKWLKESLDFKRYLKSLYELLPHVSSSLKQAALPVIKNKLGDTLDAFKKMSIDVAYQSNQDTVQQDGDFKFIGLYSTSGVSHAKSATGSTPRPKYSSFYKNSNTTTKIQTFESQITILSAKHNDTYKTLNKVTGNVEPHTIFCCEVYSFPVGVEYIQDASAIYEVIAIDEVAGKIHTVAYTENKTYPPSTLSLNEEPLAFFHATTAYKYNPWLQEKVYQHHNKDETDTEDKSGAYINSDLDYADKMIDSMSSGTEDINLDDDYYEDDY
jgi:hypothetical protein